MLTLNEGHHSHGREARAKEAAADDAARDYKDAVSHALAAGIDPSKLKNKEPLLRAEAEAHRGFAEDAKTKAASHGVTLGQLLEQVAPACFTPAEATLTEASDDITAALDALTTAWSKWSHAWAIRTQLSSVTILGGVQSGFNQQTKPPAGVGRHRCHRGHGRQPRPAQGRRGRDEALARRAGRSAGEQQPCQQHQCLTSPAPGGPPDAQA